MLLVILLLAQWCQASMSVGLDDFDERAGVVVVSDDLQSTGEQSNSPTESDLNPEHQYSAESDRRQSVASSGLHDCCPSEASAGLSDAGSSQPCDNCIDDLLTETRSACLDMAVDLYRHSLNVVDAFYHDALAQYVRYRETLWWGLSQPIYLLVGFFLE